MEKEDILTDMIGRAEAMISGLQSLVSLLKTISVSVSNEAANDPKNSQDGEIQSTQTDDVALSSESKNVMRFHMPQMKMLLLLECLDARKKPLDKTEPE